MKTPLPIQKDATVAVVCTARPFPEQQLKPFQEWLESKQLKLKIGKTVGAQWSRFGGTDSERLQELQAFLDDEAVDIIWVARGGYGSVRIVDYINWANFLKKPKWIIGFSDITVLHAAVQKMGVVSIHGTMPYNFTQKHDPLNQELIYSLIQRQPITITAPASPLNRFGKVRAPLVGGNLSLLHHMIGTPTDLDTNGKILFIEDVDEQLYQLDRMMYHLKRSRKLETLAALVVGTFSQIHDDKPPFGQTAYEIIYEQIKTYDYPVAFSIPVGHEKQNYPLALGQNYELEVSPMGTHLTTLF